MENKKDLAKIALTALILASAIPVNSQADIEAHGIFLAAGCAAHGCPAAKNDSAESATNNNNVSPSASSGGTSNFNHEYNTATDSYSNRSAVTASNSSANLTEPQLLGMLSAQGRTIYLSLDPEGKALAIQLASQDSYRDKNLAVKEAQRRTNERRK